MHNDNITVILFCEIIIIRGVLIFVNFVDFVVHVNLKNQDPKCLNIIVYAFGTLYESLVFCAGFCRSLFVLWTVYPLAVSLFVLLSFTTSEHILRIFKPF